MRWLLLPLLLLALLAPRQECQTRPILEQPAHSGAAAGEVTFLNPPLRAGNALAPLGTDRSGRDSACLNLRGLRRSLLLSLTVLGVGLLPGVALGLWWGWRGRLVALPGEALLLLALVLFLGKEAFRLVLILGVALLTARLVAVRVGTVLREPFVEGALALGGRTGHILRWHVWPQVRPSLPGLLATVLSAVFLWLMELGALGFHDQETIQVAFTDGYDRTQDIVTLPLNADLGQLVSHFRWNWLDTPEQLVWPTLLLISLSVALKDLARWAYGRTATGTDHAR